MLFAIDARNRSVTVGVREGRHWRVVRKLGASADRTADEYALLFGLVAKEAGAVGGSALPGPKGGAIEAAWMSCVVPALAPVLDAACRTAFGLGASTVGPGVKTGVKIRTDLPSEVGADLVCASVAARELARKDGKAKACVVVDFGTAITVSALNSAGEFLGTAIAPGLGTAMEALRQKAAQIPDVGLERPERAIGRTTAQAVRSGVVNGFQGLVARLVELERAELGEDCDVIGSGESAGADLFASCGFGSFHPELVLDGLAHIASKNA